MTDVPDLLRSAEACFRAGRLSDAEAAYQRVLTLEPGHPDALSQLGLLAFQSGRLESAVDYLRRSAEARPDDVGRHNNLGVALAGLGRARDAEAAFRDVLRLRPGHPEAHNNLGNLFRAHGHYTEAEAEYRAALRRNPDSPEFQSNLGDALLALGRHTEAEAAYRAALALRPDVAEVHFDLGSALRAQGRLADAEVAYRQALRLRPNYPAAHSNLGLLLLSLGRYEEGLAEYEWRFQTRQTPQRFFRQPPWSGGPLAGKTILLYPEQGIGDILQFLRYPAILKRQEATVVAECPAGLLPLVRTCPGVDVWVAQGHALPPFQVHASLMSLPHLCRTTLADVPSEVPYLSADPARVAKWRKWLGHLTGFRIGITWQGNPNFPDDRQRSIPLTAFAPLAQLPGVHLVILQKAHGRDQLSATAGWPLTDLGDRLDETAAFIDTAAVMHCLDLTVSCDSAPAHLAGALGLPVWVALSRFPNWRWLADRADSPWYPTARLYRQPRPGDWPAVFERMAADLRDKLASRVAR